MNLELLHAFGVARPVGDATPGRKRFGVPTGGPFDREAFALVHGLMNVDGSVWELGMADVLFLCNAPGSVAIVGARVTITVDGENQPDQAIFPVRKGSKLHISAPSVGARVYVGFSAAPSHVRRLAMPPRSLSSGTVRVVPGPQIGALGSDRLIGTFRVGFAGDRVGMRLEGPAVPHAIELPSEPACVGAIQITGSGQPIVLGPDGPTIGGYPKVAVVIEADLDRLAQLRPGASVSFETISFEQAAELRQARGKRLSDWLKQLVLSR